MKFALLYLSFISLVIGLNLYSSFAEETFIESDYKFSSLKIYFVEWDIITRVTLTPDNVRKMRHVYLEINDEMIVSKIYNMIYKYDFRDRDTTSPEPARLVIDFIRKDGVVETLYANKSHILNENSSKYKVMDNELSKNICSIFNLPEVKQEFPR